MKRIIRLTESDLARIVRRVIAEDMPSSIAGQEMNFYMNSNGTEARTVTISRNPSDEWKDTEGNVALKVSSLHHNGLNFNCEDQNYVLGKFKLTSQPKKYADLIVYNKDIAEKFFIPNYCSKNKQGRIVPKVSNPEMAANQNSQNNQTS